MDAWRREAIRLHRRYVLEIVEACGLCPWAERARVQERMAHEVVIGDHEAAVSASLEVLTRWSSTDRIEVGFLVYPRFADDRAAFDRFTTRVREDDASRHPLGEIPFVAAAFHPDAMPDTRDAERLIPFLRRTPDPCIQVLRASVLDRVRGTTPQGTQFFDVSAIESVLAGSAVPPLRERIARANLETAQRMGIAELRERLDAIRRDRDETYGKLAALEG